MAQFSRFIFSLSKLGVRALERINLATEDICGLKDILFHYQELGSKDKEFAVFPADRHVIIRGEGSERIFARILSFIRSRG